MKGAGSFSFTCVNSKRNCLKNATKLKSESKCGQKNYDYFFKNLMISFQKKRILQHKKNLKTIPHILAIFRTQEKLWLRWVGLGV